MPEIFDVYGCATSMHATTALAGAPHALVAADDAAAGQPASGATLRGVCSGVATGVLLTYMYAQYIVRGMQQTIVHQQRLAI